MPDVALSCYRCGHSLWLLPREKIRRQDTCAACGADLHSCVHCRFFDPGRHNQCVEPQADWVREKETSNFCEYYEPRTSVNLRARGGAGRREDARTAFDNLFKS